MVGDRDGEDAKAFIGDLAGRLANRVQLTTDGHKVYPQAVESAFGGGIDYAMLVKQYGEGPQFPERKCSPVDFVSAGKSASLATWTRPTFRSATSSAKVTMRMSMRCVARLTKGRKPRSRGCPAFHVLRFQPHP